MAPVIKQRQPCRRHGSGIAVCLSVHRDVVVSGEPSALRGIDVVEIQLRRSWRSSGVLVGRLRSCLIGLLSIAALFQPWDARESR